MLKHPNQALCKLLSITLLLFVIGLLPWVDNYAHLFGFVFGFLLSYALLPFISFGNYDRHKKVVLIWVCLLSAGFLFICLVLLFYVIPVYDCKFCPYLNCIPFTGDFCASQDIDFKREESEVWQIILRFLTVSFYLVNLVMLLLLLFYCFDVTSDGEYLLSFIKVSYWFFNC